MLAQKSIAYGYDNNGNRISRTLIVMRMGLKSNATQVNSNTIESTSDTIKSEKLITSVEKTLKVYPNPTKGKLIIDFGNSSEIKKAEYQIFSFNGTKLIHSRLDIPLTEVDVTSLPNGLYILRINVDGSSTDYKIIKQN
jgi:hypothetical protein